MESNSHQEVSITQKEELGKALKLDLETIDKIPTDVMPKLAIAVERQIIERQISAHSGPIPSPEALEHYAKVLPNLPERLTTMAEQQAKHRQHSESLGQHYAFILGLGCILGSVVAACTGHDTFASVLGGTTILGLTATFIGGQFLQLLKTGKKGPE